MKRFGVGVRVAGVGGGDAGPRRRVDWARTRLIVSKVWVNLHTAT